MFDLNKKEKPFTSFSGFGGGGLGLAGGAISAKTYVDDVFSTNLWNGNYDTTRSAIPINVGFDLAGEGGLVWTKNRNYGNHHQLYDTERNAGNVLYSSLSNGQGSNSVFDSFTSNGFSLTAGTFGTDALNGDAADTYVSWTFRKAPGFFDVLKWDGDDSTQLIPHNLGSTPGFVIAKNINDSSDWYCEHINTTPQQLKLNDPTGKNTFLSNSILGAPNPATHIRADDGSLSVQGQSYIAYVFAHNSQVFGTGGDESVIKCGTYTGTGGANNMTTENPNGPVVDLGFEPQWVMIKNTTSSSDWWIFDTMRGFIGSFNGPQQYLRPNTNAAEGTFSNYAYLRITSTGFKITAGTGAYFNQSNNSYIYMAIRRPNKPPEAAINVFAIDNQGTGTMPPQYHSNFVVDMALQVAFGESSQYRNRDIYSRLQGNKYLEANKNVAQSSTNSEMFTWMDGFGNNNSSVSTSYAWMFKRAPGFFDVVAYTGEGGSNRSVAHNLTVTPELWITKKRSATGGWFANYTVVDGTWDYLRLDYDGSVGGVGASFTLPTSTAFFVDSSEAGASDVSGVTYIAYLFATLSGISMVGSYSGDTNNPVDVDCGFASNARFIMIKRTDSSGNWYVWDSVRGINVGNEPYFLIDSDAGEVTGTDYIDAHPSNAGFRVNSGASGVPAALNVTGGTYLFLAIA